MPYILYALLSGAVLGPLLSPGYVLTLDLVFGPNSTLITRLLGMCGEWIWFTASAPLDLLFELATQIAPIWLLEKILLFCCL